MMAELQKPDGTTQALSEAYITGVVLDEFYQKTQVMIGEAISIRIESHVAGTYFGSSGSYSEPALETLTQRTRL